MAFQPAVLAGGYVTDILLTITFNSEVWEEAHLGTPPPSSFVCYWCIVVLPCIRVTRPLSWCAFNYIVRKQLNKSGHDLKQPHPILCASRITNAQAGCPTPSLTPTSSTAIYRPPPFPLPTFSLFVHVLR